MDPIRPLCKGHSFNAEPPHAAVHEAFVNERWLPYCCEIFDHDWKPQRLIKDAECEMELVVRVNESTQRHWQKRSKAG